MSIFSKREANVSRAVSVDASPIAEGLERARSLYRDAAEELFALCYTIQVTGMLPDPVLLTETLLQYRQARALTEALNLQASYAYDGETLVGTPVRPDKP